MFLFLLSGAVQKIELQPSQDVLQSGLFPGERGSLVRELQERLSDLGYYSDDPTGIYDEPTSGAVAGFQQAEGISEEDAGPRTLSAVFGGEVPASAVAEVFTYSALKTHVNLRYGSSGEDVKDLQKALFVHGYYGGDFDGVFDSETLDAVKAFQSAMNLRTDGIAGNYTLSAAYTLLSPIEGFQPQIDLKKWYSLPVKLLNWHQADKLFEVGTQMIVVDVNSGSVFHVERTGGEKHADVEMMTAADTMTAYMMCGSCWSWSRRPIWVIVDGVRYPASMNCMPHGYDTIPGNDMQGQICFHFVGSRTHISNAVDPGHSQAIQYAYEEALKTYKESK